MSYNKNIFIQALFLFCIGLTFSCSYDREIKEDLAPTIQSVENLQVALEGDTAHLSWDNPAYDGSLTAVVIHNEGTELLANAPESFDYGIIDVHTEYLFTVKLRDNLGNYSLGQTVSLYREGPQPVNNFTGTQEGTDVVLNWTLPESSDIASIRLVIDGEEEVVLAADATTYTFSNTEFQTFTFKINVVDGSGNDSPSRYLNFTVGATKIAYLGLAADVSGITDDDEAASAEWLFANYPDAEYISFADVQGGLDLAEFRVIWWHYDNQTNDPSLPAEAADPSVIQAIREFHENGGALLLNTHAVQYLWTIGRMIPDYATAIGAGEGFDNPDTWGVNVNIGTNHDKSTHPMYQGVDYNIVDGRYIIPLLGPGWKEDHNNVFVEIPAYYGLGNADEAAYSTISNENNINILGTWDGITDYFMMGIFETRPNEQFAGTAIAIGLGSFEWNQNSGNNQYRSNIETITQNALEYLKVQ